MELNLSNSQNSKKQNIIFCILLLLCVSLSSVMIHRGIGSSDEHFYTTLGWRLEQGDALFYDDWHIAQMISVFIYPLVHLYRMISGSNEGIILFMRYCYVVFNAVVGICFYLKFKNRGYGAIIGSVAWLLFTPFAIYALSYNTMGPGFLMLALLMFPYQSKNKIRLIVSGYLYALAVLNTPYLALIFFISFVVVLIKKNRELLSLFLYWFIGIVVAALIFIGFVFSRISINQLLQGLPHLIDPSHSASIINLIAKNGARITVAFGPFMIAFLFEIWMFVTKKEWINSEKKIVIANSITILSVIWILFIHRYQWDIAGFQLMLFPIAIYGLQFVIQKETPVDEKLIYICFVFDAFLISISSNVGPRSFCIPLIGASCITLMQTVNENQDRFSVITAIFMILLLGWVKSTFLYAGSGNYNTLVTSGPLKGLYDDEKLVADYNDKLEDIQIINQLENKNVALLSSNTWQYLALEKNIGTDSTYMYFWEKEEYTNAQDQYVEMHQDVLPLLIYISNDNQYQIDDNDEWIQEFNFIQSLKKGFLVERR